MDSSTEPVYVISVAARLIGVHAQTLRTYEREGLLQPARSRGGVRMYSEADIERLQLIRRFMDDLRVNIAGVDVILRLMERTEELEHQLEEIRVELQRARDKNLPAPRPFDPAGS